MPKRSVEEVVAEIKQFKEAGLSTFQAMAATMNVREWDDLIELVERLQSFWKSHADPVVRS